MSKTRAAQVDIDKLIALRDSRVETEDGRTLNAFAFNEATRSLFDRAIAAIRQAHPPEIEHLRHAMQADEERLRRAAERVGVLYVGCDTADALADEIERLRLAPPAQGMAWQDIATAPKDGTPVLADAAGAITEGTAVARPIKGRECEHRQKSQFNKGPWRCDRCGPLAIRSGYCCHSTVLAQGQAVALEIGRQRGECSADDVYDVLAARGVDVSTLGPAAGSLFSDPLLVSDGVKWVCIRWQKSRRAGNHSRAIRVWTLRPTA